MKEKNFWPLGIMSVLILGLGIVVFLVVFALKNSPKNDLVYFKGHNEVDLNFNAMLKTYENFKSNYRFLVGLNPLDKSSKTPILPYFSKGTHGDKKLQENLLKNALILEKIQHASCAIATAQTRFRSAKYSSVFSVLSQPITAQMVRNA